MQYIQNIWKRVPIENVLNRKVAVSNEYIYTHIEYFNELPKHALT